MESSETTKESRFVKTSNGICLVFKFWYLPQEQHWRLSLFDFSETCSSCSQPNVHGNLWSSFIQVPTLRTIYSLSQTLRHVKQKDHLIVQKCSSLFLSFRSKVKHAIAIPPVFLQIHLEIFHLHVHVFLIFMVFVYIFQKINNHLGGFQV